MFSLFSSYPLFMFQYIILFFRVKVFYLQLIRTDKPLMNAGRHNGRTILITKLRKIIHPRNLENILTDKKIVHPHICIIEWTNEAHMNTFVVQKVTNRFQRYFERLFIFIHIVTFTRNNLPQIYRNLRIDQCARTALMQAQRLILA